MGPNSGPPSPARCVLGGGAREVGGSDSELAELLSEIVGAGDGDADHGRDVAGLRRLTELGAAPASLQRVAHPVREHVGTGWLLRSLPDLVAAQLEREGDAQLVAAVELARVRDLAVERGRELV